MELSHIENLLQVVRGSLNTIETAGNIDYYSGMRTAIAHSINQARTFAKTAELDQEGITQINLFLCNKITRLTPPQDDLEKGMVSGYTMVKEVVLSS